LILKMCPWDRGSFGQQQNYQFLGEKNGDNFGQRGNYRYRDHNAKLGRDLGTIKLKISTFKGRMILKFI